MYGSLSICGFSQLHLFQIYHAPPSFTMRNKMKGQDDINIYKYLNYLHVMILFGVLFYFIAYCLTVYGLTTGYIYEINNFMRNLLFTQNEVIYLALFYSGVLGCILLYKFLLDYIWQFDMGFKDWVYWLRVVLTSSYLCFAFYIFVSGLLDMSHDIAVLQGVWWVYG